MNPVVEETSNKWVDVCGVADLQPNSGICVLVEDRQVAIFFLAKENIVYAIQNYDPIGKANVLSRGVIGDIKGEPVVASPLFKEHFNIVTGRCLEDESIQIESYSVRMINGRVQVGIVPNRQQ
ncbi:MAG: nitrite reductase small subunit NirD [Methylococcales bacterium]